MNFLKSPNLPDKKVKLAVVDGRTSGEIVENLKKMGVAVIKTVKHPSLYEAISYHPDVVVHHLGDDKIIYAPDTDVEFLRALEGLGFKLIRGDTELSCKYPASASYNVARIGRMAFHNFNITDPVLKEHLINSGIELVHVKQGYAKCSVSIVDEKSIITADPGIASAAKNRGIDVLYIAPERNILLPGLDYGFIGGCTGLIDKKTWAITGRLDTLKAAGSIIAFLFRHGVIPVELSQGPVIDYGSIIPLLTFDL